jgi:hypothetical protein
MDDDPSPQQRGPRINPGTEEHPGSVSLHLGKGWGVGTPTSLNTLTFLYFLIFAFHFVFGGHHGR